MENETNPFVVGSEPYMISSTSWGEIVSCRKVKVKKSLANNRFKIEGSNEMYRAELSYHDKVWSAQVIKSGWGSGNWLAFTYPKEEITRAKLRRESRDVLNKISAIQAESLNQKQLDMLNEFLKDIETKF